MTQPTSSHSAQAVTAKSTETGASTNVLKPTFIAEELERTAQNDTTLTPSEVDRYRRFLAGWAALKHAQYGKLRVARANWTTQKRDEFKSIAETERNWEATEDGNTFIALHEQLKAVDLLLGVLESTHFLLQAEAKNQV